MIKRINKWKLVQKNYCIIVMTLSHRIPEKFEVIKVAQVKYDINLLV